MKQVYLVHENHPKLLIFFAGWAADETPFKQYRPKGMDYMICYDYRTLDFDISVFDHYRQINVVAWSMGVWAASLILSQLPKKNILSIAFNGSTLPIDNLEGIPLKIYQDTLDKLTPDSLQKFLRNMCANSEAYKAFMKVTPRRDFHEIKEELRCIQEQYFELYGNMQCKDYTEEEEDKFEENANKYRYEYDYGFIGTKDRIIPYKNMELNYGDPSDGTLIVTDCAHYDESMFRFLLQDMWEMPLDDLTHRLREMDIEYNYTRK